MENPRERKRDQALRWRKFEELGMRKGAERGRERDRECQSRVELSCSFKKFQNISGSFTFYTPSLSLRFPNFLSPSPCHFLCPQIYPSFNNSFSQFLSVSLPRTSPSSYFQSLYSPFSNFSNSEPPSPPHLYLTCFMPR